MLASLRAWIRSAWNQRRLLTYMERVNVSIRQFMPTLCSRGKPGGLHVVLWEHFSVRDAFLFAHALGSH